MEKQMINRQLNEERKRFGIVFLVSVMIWVIVFAFAEVGLGYDISLTFSDAYHQYLPFHSELREIILNKDWGSFLYHWELGLGSSFFGVYSYYLGSPFVWLSLFFETTQLPLYFYLIILFKVGLSSVFAFIFFKNQPNVTQNKAMLFSVLYACIGAMVDRFYNVMWLDAIMLLPLTIWSLQRLIHLQRWKGFFGCLVYLFWTNFYMGYMVGIFCFFWFCLEVYLYCQESIKEKWKLFGRFIGCAGLAVLVCGALLWPTILMLKENSYSKEIAFEETHHLLQSLSDFFIGSYNGLESISPGNIYITLFGLLMAISFFFNATFSKKERLLFGGVVTFFFVSFSVPLLDWIWHGFKMPKGFPNRYAFLLSFLLLYLGCRSFSEPFNLDEKAKKRWFERTVGCYLGLIGVVFVATFFEELGLKTIIDSSLVGVSFFFGIIYTIFFFCWKVSKSTTVRVKYLFLTILGVELIVNGFMAAYMLKVTQYSYRGESVASYESIETALEELDLEVTDRFLLPYQNLNAGLFHNVKTLENYNTLGHRQTNSFIHQLYRGASEIFSEEARNEFLRTKPSLMLDSLLGVKYYYRPTLKEGVLSEMDWLEVLSSNWIQNPYQLPLAFKIDPLAIERMALFKWSSSPEENQEALLNMLLGLTLEDENYLNVGDGWGVELIALDNFEFNPAFKLYVKRNSDKPGTMTFKITPPKNGMDGEVRFSLNIHDVVQIEIDNGVSFEMIESKTIPSFGDAESYLLTLTLSEKYNHSLDLLRVSTVNDDLMIDGLKQLKENGLGEWKLEGPNAELSVDLKEEGLYWLNIPYSPNWVATIDGEEVPLLSIQDAFMAIELPKGQYTLSLTYHVSGLGTGVMISLMGISLFSSILIISNQRKQ